MTRDEFDALAAAAASAIVAAVDPASDDAAAAREEAQLLEAQSREFADAVDRNTKRIDYAAAVVLEGTNGIAVVTLADYGDAPAYWRTVAGRLDRLTFGDELVQGLQVAARQGSPAGS